jgi:hypothetical protein
MTGLLDYPPLPGLLPMPNWDDLAQRVPPGVSNAPFWHLPVAPPAAGMALAPMMSWSDPSRSPFVPPPRPIAGPTVVNWIPPPMAPDNTGAVGVYPAGVRRRRRRDGDMAPLATPPAASLSAATAEAVPAEPPAEMPIDEQQALRDAFEAYTRRMQRGVRHNGLPPAAPAEAVPAEGQGHVPIDEQQHVRDAFESWAHVQRRSARPNGWPLAAVPATVPAEPAPEGPINEQQEASDAFEAAALRRRRGMMHPPARPPSRLTPMVSAVADLGPRYWRTHNTVRRDAQDLIGYGVNQMDSAMRGDAGIKTFGKGLANTAVGTMNYVASPINAGLRWAVGNPVEQLTRGFIPKEGAEFVASLLTPIPKSIPLPRGRAIDVPPEAEKAARIFTVWNNLRTNSWRPLTDGSDPKNGSAVPSMGDWHIP